MTVGVMTSQILSQIHTQSPRALENAIQQEVAYHKTTNFSDYGMVLVCSLYGGKFIEIFDNSILIDGMNALLGDGCILYAYTSSSMPPDKSNYSKRIHVDSPRFISNDYYTNAGAMVILDDFTEQRIDIPRAMSEMDQSKLSETAKQKLGFFAQVPASYDEYYVQPEFRKFKQKVE